METEFPDVFALDDARKSALIVALMDSMGIPGATYTTSDEFFDELDRRHAEHLRNPASAISADEFFAKIDARRSERRHV